MTIFSLKQSLLILTLYLSQTSKHIHKILFLLICYIFIKDLHEQQKIKFIC